MSKKIYIVAGHGQGDPGAVGNGYQEANLTRKVANDIYSQMAAAKKDIVLYPTQRNLYKTKDYSYFAKGSYVLEIHFNSAAVTATGTELLFKEGTRADSTDIAIYNSMVPFFKGRGIKARSDLGNMNNFAKLGIDYSLLEVCFISSAADIKTFHDQYDNIIKSLTTALSDASSATSGASSSSGSSSQASPASSKDNWVAELQTECNKQGFSNQKVDGIAGPKTLAVCPTVKQGAKNGITKLIQQRLNAQGYNSGIADGIFGSKTTAAVKAYQKAKALTVDGIVGKNTWRKLLGL